MRGEIVLLPLLVLLPTTESCNVLDNWRALHGGNQVSRVVNSGARARIALVSAHTPKYSIIVIERLLSLAFNTKVNIALGKDSRYGYGAVVSWEACLDLCKATPECAQVIMLAPRRLWMPFLSAFFPFFLSFFLPILARHGAKHKSHIDVSNSIDHCYSCRVFLVCRISPGPLLSCALLCKVVFHKEQRNCYGMSAAYPTEQENKGGTNYKWISAQCLDRDDEDHTVLRVMNGVMVTGGKNGWSPYSTCPLGYVRACAAPSLQLFCQHSISVLYAGTPIAKF